MRLPSSTFFFAALLALPAAAQAIDYPLLRAPLVETELGGEGFFDNGVGLHLGWRVKDGWDQSDSFFSRIYAGPAFRSGNLWFAAHIGMAEADDRWEYSALLSLWARAEFLDGRLAVAFEEESLPNYGKSLGRLRTMYRCDLGGAWCRSAPDQFSYGFAFGLEARHDDSRATVGPRLEFDLPYGLDLAVVPAFGFQDENRGLRLAVQFRCRIDKLREYAEQAK